MIAADLQRYLQQSRHALVASLDGLSEHDVRRPLTPTGTNLLGLLKHLAGVELGYLGRAVGRTPPLTLGWEEDGSIWENADMWATADQTRAEIVDLYRTAWAHSDASIAELPLDHPAYVEHWPEDRRATTFGHLLVRCVDETGRHAGQADILRESLVGTAARDPEMGDVVWWDAYVARVQAAADQHAHGG